MMRTQKRSDVLQAPYSQTQNLRPIKAKPKTLARTKITLKRRRTFVDALGGLRANRRKIGKIW